MDFLCKICLILSIITSAICYLMHNTTGAYYFLGFAILLVVAIRTFGGDNHD